jgi:hypothetical protein
MSLDSPLDSPTTRCANPPMNRPRSPVSGCTRTTGWTVSYLIEVNTARRSRWASFRLSGGTA